MLNVKFVFGYIATAALVLSPLTVRAQDAQVSNQGSIQKGVQAQLEATGVYDDPQQQISGQESTNLGAVDGYFNYVDQYGYQGNSQVQTAVDSYLGY